MSLVHQQDQTDITSQPYCVTTQPLTQTPLSNFTQATVCMFPYGQMLAVTRQLNINDVCLVATTTTVLDWFKTAIYVNVLLSSNILTSSSISNIHINHSVVPC